MWGKWINNQVTRWAGQDKLTGEHMAQGNHDKQCAHTKHDKNPNKWPVKQISRHAYAHTKRTRS